MTLRQFLDFTKDVPAAEVTRAVNTVLASGPAPRTRDEYLRFRMIVWLHLRGRLRPTG